ncbi:MAG: sensor histidine kinase [Brumimicrobium sp.]|nr:sensor histidine kinase [Brumimicrobium sp.]MCO5267300.1 sensor histidine kinase [Brumimicrobium sp.]
MIVIILTTHFVLGIKWGRFYILLTSIVYFLYFNFFFLDTEGFKIILQPHTLFIYTIEFIITLFLIGFIMYNYETLNEKIISKYTDAFYELKDEKIVVEKQNQEKAILLQEIHHRVKNNFQIIVSLLRMQSNTIEDEETRDSFQQAINRIATMSLVHQKLYESTSLAEVNLNEYLEKLVHEIMNSYSVQGNITYSVHSEIENFDSEKIVMLGLIINELVSNSLKYAFKGEGNINIHIFRSEEGSVQLNYSDNGKWLKKPNNQAFGIKLIDIFIEQLDGTYERMIKENGTFYYFKLRNII